MPEASWNCPRPGCVEKFGGGDGGREFLFHVRNSHCAPLTTKTTPSAMAAGPPADPGPTQTRRPQEPERHATASEQDIPAAGDVQKAILDLTTGREYTSACNGCPCGARHTHALAGEDIAKLILK